MVKKLLAILLFTGLFVCTYAQNLSNKGREFWVGYGHNFGFENNNDQEMVIYLSAEQAATVTVSIYGTAWSQTYNVAANSVVSTATIPKVAPYDARLFDPASFSEKVFSNKAVHIVSNVPIVAYAHVYASTNSGATMLMPVETWGYSYTSINSAQNYQLKTFSWCYVIANHDNTTVEITPTQTTRTGNIANDTYTIELNKGEIYQFLAGPETGNSKPELTGSKVKSVANAAGECYPIAVFSGSSRTYNPAACTGTNSGGDYDNQQCFPQQAWGKRYLTAPTNAGGMSGGAPIPITQVQTNVYKVLVKDPTTVVKRNGVILSPATLLVNSYYIFESNQPEYIEADKPIMVAQFMSTGTCRNSPSGKGDPEMIYLSPIEQGIKRMGFYKNSLSSINWVFITLIIPNGGLSTLRIDGISSWDYEYPHPSLAGYTVVVKRWGTADNINVTPGQSMAQSDSAFTAITYGLGNVESYGYNAGTLINNLQVQGVIHNNGDPNPQSVHPFTCQGSPMTLSMLISYQPTSMVWQLSNVPGISPNADVTINNPVPVQTVVINGVTYYQYTLPGAYTFSVTGDIPIPVKVTHPSIDNCNNSEVVTFAVKVNGKPQSDFTPGNYVGCMSDAISFNGITPTPNNYNVAAWNWLFPDATTSTIQNPVKTFNLTPGIHNVKLSVTTAEGCVGDTIKTITLSNAPHSTLAANVLSGCVGTSVNFTGTTVSGGSTITGYHWNFGDGNTANPVNNDPQTHTFNTPGTYIVKYTANSSPCHGDTATITITIHTPPTASFSFPNSGCLDPSGLVQFTGISSSNGVAINNHSWNFGDANATPANPNTSTIQNPTHNYTTFGNYTITYSVTDANGCTDDSVYTATFNLKPTLAYPALNAVCQNSAVSSVATGSVTNGVPGSGIYHGPGTTSAGMFDPAVAGAGTHTIWYVFTSTANCKDSISQSIVVNPAPQSNFSVSPTSTCLPASGLVNFTFTGSNLAGQNYSWQFGDGGSSTLQNPSHNYATSGTYTIVQTVTTPQGCTDDSTYNLTINLKPVVTYAAIPAICQNASPVSIANGGVSNGIAGTGVYHGPGTSSAGMLDPAVAGAGTHTIWYVFTSTAGCADSASQTVVVNPAPQSNFSLSATNGCLPPSGLVNFTFTGSNQAGQNYSWQFGDGGSSTLQNPSHNYATSGTYTIVQTVTTPQGCTDDSTYNLTINLKPVVTYTPIPAICQNASPVSIANGGVSNGIAGTGVYHGPGTSSTGMLDPAVAGAGTHTIWYVFTSTAGCADSASQTVVVNPAPRSNFSIQSANCLPVSGQVQFNFTGDVLPGQSYSWNFGDANATPGNPNTSTIQNPTHNYVNTGNYVITLSVNSGGCIDDTVYNATFNVTPVLNYPALASLCEGAAPANIATATVTNGVVNGIWDYSGPGTSSSGSFDPVAAGPGVHTITATFTSAAGCSASTTRQIRVNPRPLAAFTPSGTSLCLGSQVLFTNNSTIVSGSNIDHLNWDFGDGSAPLSAPYTVPVPYTYNNYGPYTVSLVAVSDSGCNSLPVTQVVNIRANPVADFTMPASVCMPNGSATFTSTTTVGDNSNMTYTWDFGDGNTGSGSPASHVYNAMSTYNIQLTATTQYGCTHDTIKQFSAFFDKPVSYFKISDSALCQGKRSTFTDSSWAPNSSITARKWDFGDGTSSSAASYAKLYAQPGVYTVKLVVWNSQGCISDTFSRTVTVYLQPVVDAGPNFYVADGTVIQFQPIVNDSSATVAYHWTPEVGLTNPYAIRPLHFANGARIYTLTAIGEGGCTASDYLSVNVFRPITVPNAFSPNGDGINDTWEITNLQDYPSAFVEVYNRYGQMVYRSPYGYTKPWDGTVKGKPLPFGTYYYIIDLKDGKKPLNGPITLIK